MKRHHLQIGETIATVIAHPEYIPVAEKAIHEARFQIESYISQHPYFGTSHEPVEVGSGAPDIIKRMAEASQQVGVGPMASVAGAIAEYTVKQMIAAGASHAIFDNGGDIAMYLEYPIIAGIYTGSRGLNGLGLRITQTKTILGLCTSSATVGHSLSYGKTDASIIYSEDVILADAAATALGNAVSQKDTRLIESSLNKIMIDGIKGAMVTIEDTIGVCGHLPELVRANVDFELISKGGLVNE
jgi:ApbE superfamily uncharacterized protein (UPF0280 family)